MVAAAGSAVGIAEGMSARPLAPWVRVGATATVIVTARADRMSARPLAPVEELTIDAAGMPMGAAPLDMVADGIAAGRAPELTGCAPGNCAPGSCAPGRSPHAAVIGIDSCHRLLLCRRPRHDHHQSGDRGGEGICV